MPRISPVSADLIDTQTKATLDAVKAKIGMVPNLYATLAHAPVALNAYLALVDGLSGGVLTAPHREIISLVTAQANGCQYCLSAHTLLGKAAGLSEEAMQAARCGTGTNELDEAIARFAFRLIETRGQVTDVDVAAARSTGLTDAQIVEIVANVAMNVLTNFTNNVAATVIDFPEIDLALVA